MIFRAYACGFSALMIAAVISPVFGDPLLDDSFPLSTYPMFARPLPEAKAALPSVWAVMDSGERRRVPASLLGSQDVLQALVRVRQTLERGPEATAILCRDVADALRRAPQLWDGARQVEVVTQWLDAVDYFSGQHEPLSSRLHVRCEVMDP